MTNHTNLNTNILLKNFNKVELKINLKAEPSGSVQISDDAQGGGAQWVQGGHRIQFSIFVCFLSASSFGFEELFEFSKYLNPFSR